MILQSFLTFICCNAHVRTQKKPHCGYTVRLFSSILFCSRNSNNSVLILFLHHLSFRDSAFYPLSVPILYLCNRMVSISYGILHICLCTAVGLVEVSRARCSESMHLSDWECIKSTCNSNNLRQTI